MLLLLLLLLLLNSPYSSHLESAWHSHLFRELLSFPFISFQNKNEKFSSKSASYFGGGGDYKIISVVPMHYIFQV